VRSSLERGESGWPACEARGECGQTEQRLMGLGVEGLWSIDTARPARIRYSGSGERGRRSNERERRRKTAEARGTRSPPQEHEGAPYSTLQLCVAAAVAHSDRGCAKLQHFHDGSPLRSSGRLVTVHRL